METTVLSDDTLLFVVDSPVEREDTPVLKLDTPVDSELTPVDRLETPVDRELTAVDAEVDSDATLLFVVERPVLSELTPVLKLDIPVDVEVDSESRLLSVVERPVLRLETAVEVDVDSESIAVSVAKSCEPLIASVLVPVTRPAATFVTCRSAPTLPTLTTLDGVPPAYVYDLPPMLPVAVGLAAAVTEPVPNARLFALAAVAS
ncbi:hypothetical protein ABIC50_002852 [Burkholderia sp. 567]